MSQVSPTLRRTERGYGHWCPGCLEMHVIFDNWTFDGNVDVPTFNPSVKIGGKQIVIVNGKWTGEWVRDADGKTIDNCCHYFLHAWKLLFQGDCTHALKGQTVPLPDLPNDLTDKEKVA